jgi:hypothetical protein
MHHQPCDPASGNPKLDTLPAVVLLRRFGSFEVAKASDPITQRPGPSPGMASSLLLPLLGYCIRQHYSSLWQFYGGGADLSMADMDEGHVSAPALLLLCLF